MTALSLCCAILIASDYARALGPMPRNLARVRVFSVAIVRGRQLIDFEVEHVYVGTRFRVGQCLSLEPSGQDLVSMPSSWSEGDQAVWCWPEDLILQPNPTRHTVRVDGRFLGGPWPRIEPYAAREHPLATGWAEAVEAVGRADRAERRRLLRDYATSENLWVASWAIQCLHCGSERDLLPFLAEEVFHSKPLRPGAADDGTDPLAGFLIGQVHAARARSRRILAAGLLSLVRPLTPSDRRAIEALQQSSDDPELAGTLDRVLQGFWLPTVLPEGSPETKIFGLGLPAELWERGPWLLGAAVGVILVMILRRRQRLALGRPERRRRAGVAS